MSEPLGKWMTVSLMTRRVGARTDRWIVLDREGGVLGKVRWLGRWRQYCFVPGQCATFSAGCLDDLAGFIRAQMRARKAMGN